MSKNKSRLQSKIERVGIGKQLISGIAKGYTITGVCEALVNEYSVKDVHLAIAGLFKDWKQRDKWLPLVVKLDGEKDVINNLILEMRALRKTVQMRSMKLMSTFTLITQTMRL